MYRLALLTSASTPARAGVHVTSDFSLFGFLRSDMFLVFAFFLQRLFCCFHVALASPGIEIGGGALPCLALRLPPHFPFSAYATLRPSLGTCRVFSCLEKPPRASFPQSSFISPPHSPYFPLFLLPQPKLRHFDPFAFEDTKCK